MDTITLAEITAVNERVRPALLKFVAETPDHVVARDPSLPYRAMASVLAGAFLAMYPSQEIACKEWMELIKWRLSLSENQNRCLSRDG